MICWFSDGNLKFSVNQRGALILEYQFCYRWYNLYLKTEFFKRRRKYANKNNKFIQSKLKNNANVISYKIDK